MRAYKSVTQNLSIWEEEVGGKGKMKSIIVVTWVSDISLAMRRKVKQRDVVDMLNTPETYSFLRIEVVKFLRWKHELR